MELLDIMRSRRSIRKYTGEEIPEKKMERILQAGLLAPTSRNKRPWEYYVVRDPRKLDQLSRAKWHGSSLLAGARAAIAVTADSDLSDAWIEDSSIALAYMDLMASSQGVGSCWVQMRMRKDQEGGDAEDNVRRILGLDLPIRIVGILALGMPDEQREAYDLDGLLWEKVHRD